MGGEGWFPLRMSSGRSIEELEEENAQLRRTLYQNQLQIERMQGQLERAMREVAFLRTLLRRTPPPEPSSPSPSPSPTSSPDESSPPKPSQDPSPKPTPGPSPKPSPEPTPGPSPKPSPEPSPKPSPKPSDGKPKKGKFGRNEIPKNLERVREEVETPPCPSCGGSRLKELRREVVNFYDYVPAKVVVRQVERAVCRCKDCQQISTAPFPEGLLPRMRATPSLIAHIIYEKYGRHLPLYRVVMELERLGAQIPETTEEGWPKYVAALLFLLLDVLKKKLFEEKIVFTDGTSYPVIVREGFRHLGQMAVFCNDVATMYEFTSTKEGVHQRLFLGIEETEPSSVGDPETTFEVEETPPPPLTFEGYQIADASSVSDQTYKDGIIVECGCNAHARRKFEEAEETDRVLAGEALSYWSALYKVEEQAKGKSAEERLLLRREFSLPVVADLRRWLNLHQGTRLPKEPLTQAMNYLQNHWRALFRFLEDGRIPIDNNFAERQLKAIAIGRKNYLFAGSQQAAEQAAVFYTFVMTCRQHKVDPHAWLTYVLPRILTTRPSDYDRLLPMNWQSSSSQKVVRQAA